VAPRVTVVHILVVFEMLCLNTLIPCGWP